MPEFETIIGLETHIQLNTTTKIFCSCKADSWGDPPNTNICPICTGLPGVLPVLNKSVVEKAILLAGAIHAEINPVSLFDRKNYFYPDLPKGYQISQYNKPLANGGYFDIPMPYGDFRRITINKLHIEEDAGKTKNDYDRRLIDFNRCGVPLIELVTGPDLRSPDEAAQFIIRLRQLLRWLVISEANMEKGHLRCDANVSIRPKGADYLNIKTEIKNLNSIVAIREAIQTEIERQAREVEIGKPVEAWTLEWDEDAGKLRKMRSKESEADYRYFKEPDLLPLFIEQIWREKILTSLPELPLERRERFTKMFGITDHDADILTSDKALSEYFETAANLHQGDQKRVSNWLINDVLRLINELGIPANKLLLTPEYLIEIINLVEKGIINTTTGKTLLEKVQTSEKSPQQIVESEGLVKVSDETKIRTACQEVLSENPTQVANYKNGKVTLIGWFVGQVMQKMRGKADPQITRSILEDLLRQ